MKRAGDADEMRGLLRGRSVDRARAHARIVGDDRDAPAAEGAVVPRSAVVRHAGKAWVYVRVGDDAFHREELAVDRAVPEGWVTTADWAKNARVVVTGAQSVLSTEIQNASGAGGEEE